MNKKSPPAVFQPLPSVTKEENDPVKNLIDVYRVGSEEVRHSASIIWRFSMAILVFQGTAIYYAIDRASAPAFLGLLLVGMVSGRLCRLLQRQCLDRSELVERLKATEASLRNSYRDSFKPIGGGEEHDYKSTHLAADLSLVALLISLVAFVGVGFCSLNWLSVQVSGKPLLEFLL